MDEAAEQCGSSDCFACRLDRADHTQGGETQ
jgi:hypothetical protein